MLQEYYFVEVRSLREGDIYKLIEHKHGLLSVYKDYSCAYAALLRLKSKNDCLRIVRCDGVIMCEYKKLFQGG